MRLNITINTALAEGYNGLANEMIARSTQHAQEIMNEYVPRIEADLQYEPEPPSYPEGEFDWTSDRQRIKVMILLTEAAIGRGDFTVGPRGGKRITDLRYKRDHGLAQGYKTLVVFDGGRTLLSISNNWSAAKFVVGTFNQRSLEEAASPQQRFHAGRWPLIAARLRYWFDQINSEYRERMTTEFSNAVRVIASRRSFQ